MPQQLCWGICHGENEVREPSLKPPRLSKGKGRGSKSMKFDKPKPVKVEKDKGY